MLTRSSSGVNSMPLKDTFFSTNLNMNLEIRVLKKFEKLTQYIIVESGFDRTKKQVEIIAEAAVRPLSTSVTANTSKKYANSKFLENEIRDRLINFTRIFDKIA